MNRDRLHLWQDRLARNDSQYENWYALMDERERLYQGSRYIFPLVNKYRPASLRQAAYGIRFQNFPFLLFVRYYYHPHH